MKLAGFRAAGRTSYGAVADDGIIDLGRRFGARAADLRAFIAAGLLEAARGAIAGASADHSLADVVLLPPVPAPEKIWCIGVNYPDRNAEYRDGSDAPEYPSVFVRVPTSLVGHGTPIERPRVSERLDYEGEIVLVIGRGGRHITREAALSHVFGMTLCNEGSVRDWMRHGKFNVTQGKNFDRSGSMGPWIVTADEADPAAARTLTTRVNGEIRQQDSTDRLVFGFAYLIAYLSAFATLSPGDLIVTGTPTGAGTSFDPPKWLRAGDVVEVEASGLGVLHNAVVDES
ncbi:MAG TPA: fumarylacetoacetate hydrolase family protein [Acetobacteraceae bacterium]|jgi:2-keto-4-pentenoate hydratase/2-oxohepta-3-ene-1,7-dioic acid hydratase in catechol pathway|nr:fumarylacetoacetate hydrolase family protein [Acetobacteraceae bacterium]